MLACWVHARRYFWKATMTESGPAHEAMALIDRLFAVEAHCKRVPRAARTEFRAKHAQPILDAFDTWVTRVNDTLVESRRRIGQAGGGQSLLAVARRELDRPINKRNQTSD